MLASMVQYQAFAVLALHPFEAKSLIVVVIGVFPLVIYCLICLVFFRRVERRMMARAPHADVETAQ
ncbi:hypothetical protein IAG41_06845 [Sphingomonas sp. JC676]|uniref:hypothetical protein n=1 Tax=Sphingomonas sp. JC676 TaxID=2768065 RepID=UPI00165866E8|nr:hypothetical protein [Sphingomonas sp. JC676]MBC9032105.1 hypothetical protein [Sphingomonas sp. JC676]